MKELHNCVAIFNADMPSNGPHSDLNVTLQQNDKLFLVCFISNMLSAFLGVKRREICEEDLDRRSLHLAGQGGYEEESGQLAQTVCQLHSDQPLSTTPKGWQMVNAEIH